MSDGAPTPLCDLRVVEISDRIAGSYCGKLLVDAGADVVKVEPDTAATHCAASPQPAPCRPPVRRTAVQLSQRRENAA